jgi:hypothetical protein
MAAQRIDEIIELLQAYVLDGLDLPHEQVMAALALLNWAIPDASLPNDGAADDQAVLTFH